MHNACLYRRTQINYQRYRRNYKQLYLPSICPSAGSLVTATFANLPFNFKTSITSTRTLALSSNLDESKDKVSEKSHKIISLASYPLPAPFFPLKTRGPNALERRARTLSSRSHCRADVHCAPLKSSGHGPRLVFTSVTVQVVAVVELVCNI